ncbi:MAG: DUF1592 domain-containing protein [Verrucomicrobiota bacterium]
MSRFVQIAFVLMVLCLDAQGADARFEEDFSSGAEAIEKWSMKNRAFWKVTTEGHLASLPSEAAKIVGCASNGFPSGSDLTYSFDFKLQEAKELNFKINFAEGGHIYRLVVNRFGFFLRINTNRNIPIPQPATLERVVAPVDPRKWHTATLVQNGATVSATIPGVGSRTWKNAFFVHPVATIGLSASGGEALFDNIRVMDTQAEPVADVPAPKSSTAPMASFVANSSPELHPVVDSAWLDSIDPFLDSHCFDCHDDVVAEGNLDLLSLSTDLNDSETLRRWVRVFDRVKKGEMPPEKKPRPGEADKEEFLTYLKAPLIEGHRSQREVVLRRLNRAEYENTVNDLFGIDLRIKETFPEDAKKHGFDNNGEGLTLSSELIQLYLNAANSAFDRAIGLKIAPRHTRIEGEIRDYIHDNMYDRWQKLMEDKGGTVIYSSEFAAGSQLNHLKLPEPGTYRWRFHVKAYQTDKPVMMQIQTGQLTRQGDKRFIGFFEIPPEGRIVEFTDYMLPGESAYPRPFGTIRNISGFLGPNQGQERGLTIRDYEGAGLLVEHFEVEGPIEEWPPPSRLQLLGETDLASGSPADAANILKRFLPRAFRRPVATAEFEKYAEKVRELMDGGRSFEESLRWAINAALCSPDFLFLEEPFGEDGLLSDYALANRLSYYLWSSMPDAELTALAASGEIRNSNMLREQTERLLSSEKARAFTKNFAHQWLHLREIDATSPDTKLFPDFDNYLKQSMVRESEAFFETVLSENGSIRNFIESDWVMINERLARHYGIPDVAGEGFQRVSLSEESVRGGIMTQGSVLKVTANGANTSPVNRGVWILENLLGIHPPPPPPSIPAVVPDVTGAKTLRQLLAAHSNEQSCQSCHELIDPPGFALENFDPVGAWRTQYAFQGSRNMLPVDATGVTEKGEAFKDVRDYKKIILREIDQVTYGLTEKLLNYATGRAMGFSDRSEIYRLVDEVAASNYGFRDLVHATIQSPTFRQP